MDNTNSLNTIDNLIEFGMGVAIAQQMVNTMNYCIGNMKVPGMEKPVKKVESDKPYHVVVNNSVVGPFSEDQISALVQAKTMTQETLVWKPGMIGWKPAKAISDINRMFI